MTIWAMRIACWIPKPTHTHKNVILIVFPLQQWLRAHASMWRSTLPVLLYHSNVPVYFACLNPYCVTPGNRGDNAWRSTVSYPLVRTSHRTPQWPIRHIVCSCGACVCVRARVCVWFELKILSVFFLVMPYKPLCKTNEIVASIRYCVWLNYCCFDDVRHYAIF